MKKKVTISLPPDSHLGIFGPPGSGKTAGVLIPHVLRAPAGDIVVVASLKGDILEATMGWRQNFGPVAVYDPMSATPIPTCVWDPKSGVTTWSDRLERANLLVRAGGNQQSITGGGTSKWERLAATSFACMMEAADLGGLGMREIMSWILAFERDHVVQLLARDPTSMAAKAFLGAMVRQHEDGASSIFTTLNMNLAAWTIESVLESATGPSINFDELVVTPGATHYVVADPATVELTAPIMAAHLDAFLSACERQANAHGGRLPYKVHLIIDELPSLAPVPRLATRLRTMRSMGVSITWVSQSLPDLYAPYGRENVGSILGNSSRMIFGGLGDTDTLSYVEHLVGQAIVKRKSKGKGDHESENENTEALLGAHVVRGLKTWQTIFVHRQLPPVRVTVTPYFEDKLVSSRANLQIETPPQSEPAVPDPLDAGQPDADPAPQAPRPASVPTEESVDAPTARAERVKRVEELRAKKQAELEARRAA